ncbi:hypothetical protein [Aliidiomarina soli]|uniref:ATP-binding protein n=1 Tax=Aliidiomarina soli TaxID=1928574 RepID=A0A432WEE4_9GAMM|nr:hypothetical protein [Aliidiomarina soli]RUO31232.1 hypothetical protein CWE14_12130 [Aliidiomarina soli]
MLRMPVNLDTTKLEELIKNSLETANRPSQLELPVGTNRLAFGGYAAATQAVNTWFYANENDATLKLKTPFDASELIHDPHKFTAFMMARNFSTNEVENYELKKKIYTAAKQQIEEQSKSQYGQTRGRLCWFSFVDHSTKGFDKNFYINSPHKKPIIRNEAQISNIIRAMVEQSSKVAGGGTLPPYDDVKNLGRVFEELFHNTHEHGSRGTDKNTWLKPATRLIYTYGINLNDNAILNASENEEWLTAYLKTLEKNGLATQHFIEISVIDSGLGFCGRWLSDNPEEAEQLEKDEKFQYSVLKRCFEFKKTSTGIFNKGHGLTAVMEHLTKLNGFLKVRSNKLSVYRDFASEPFSLKSPDYEFFDWITKKRCPENVTLLPEARGVAITLLIPLNAKSYIKENS